MIIKDKKRSVQRSSDFKSNKFTIAATAESFRILSKDLYTNQIQAVVRELSTNAQDSHTESGNDNPFDVHLPTQLEPFFSVRDYGTGLSQEDCETIYTGYFNSTKTNTNELNGCLGLGSKSPFSIAESFSVVSRFNGKKLTYLAFKDEDGIPDLSLLTEEDTDEPNGLEVIIDATGKINEFDKEAIRVYRYFDKIPNINKEEVKEEISNLRDSYLIKADDFAVKNKYGTLFAVMGNVAYPIANGTKQGFAGYINFPIGSLRFEPGRERLVESDENKAVIQERLESIKPRIESVINEELSSKETDYDKARYAHEISHSAIGRSFGWTLDEYSLPKASEEFQVFGSYTKYFTNKIPMGDVEFYKDTQRVKNRLTLRANNYGKTCIMLTDDQAAECKIPLDLLKDPSELPKPSRSNRSNTSYRPENIFKADSRNFSYSNSTWKDVTSSEVKDEDKYYVEIYRWKPQFHMFTSHVVKAVRYLKEKGVDVPTLYGVKGAEIRKKRFQKDTTWKSFEERVVELLKENVGDCTLYEEGYHADFFREIAGFYNHGLFAELRAIDTSNEEILSLCSNFGIDIATSDAIIKLEEKILDRYPGIQYWSLPWNYQESQVRDVLRKFDARS